MLYLGGEALVRGCVFSTSIPEQLALVQGISFRSAHAIRVSLAATPRQLVPLLPQNIDPEALRPR
jgi:hypothetical protein